VGGKIQLVGIARRCLNCDTPIPRDAPAHRKFCDNNGACRVQYYRHKRNPNGGVRGKVAPPSNGTGDKAIDKILDLHYEATLRKRLLDELLDQRKEEGRRDAFADAEKWKEDRVLDPDTRRKVARFLAETFDPSRTGGSG